MPIGNNVILERMPPPAKICFTKPPDTDDRVTITYGMRNRSLPWRNQKIRGRKMLLLLDPPCDTHHPADSSIVIDAKGAGPGAVFCVKSRLRLAGLRP